MKLIVQFSGGKDSLATLLYVIEHYTKKPEVVFCDTGWESGVTLAHIGEIEEQTGLRFKYLRSRKYKDFLDLCVKKKRAPSTKARFCTASLKIEPMIDFILDEVKDNSVIYQGVRGDESLSRSKMPKQCGYFDNVINNFKFSYRRKEILEYCKIYSTDLIRPIFEWTANEVFNYIHTRGFKANPLYYEGFQRVGCFPCIMCRHREIKLIAEKHPEYISKVEKIEHETGRSFFGSDYIPAKYCANKQFPMISDVIRYVTDDPAQEKMFDEEPKSCQSVYNICE